MNPQPYTMIKPRVSTAAASLVRALFFSSGLSKWKEEFVPNGSFIVFWKRSENGLFLILQRPSPLFQITYGLFFKQLIQSLSINCLRYLTLVVINCLSLT